MTSGWKETAPAASTDLVSGCMAFSFSCLPRSAARPGFGAFNGLEAGRSEFAGESVVVDVDQHPASGRADLVVLEVARDVRLGLGGRLGIGLLVDVDQH